MSRGRPRKKKENTDSQFERDKKAAYQRERRQLKKLEALVTTTNDESVNNVAPKLSRAEYQRERSKRKAPPIDSSVENNHIAKRRRINKVK